MTPEERDMLQFAVWCIAYDKLEKQRDISEIQYGHTHQKWVELWNKIIERKL